MRTIVVIILMALASMTVLSRPLSLIVSIPPQQEAVRAIVGEDARIMVLVPKGASPETYSPSAGEIRRLAEADMLFTIGVPIEKVLVPKLQKLNSSLLIVDTTTSMKYRDMEGGHAHHNHGAKDPHVWLSIDNMIIHAQNVSAALTKNDSTNADAFTARANDYIASLKKLQEELANSMKHLAGGKLMVFHPAFGYFLDQYGMTQIPVELDGHEPSGKHLAKISNLRSTAKAFVLFVQPQSNKSLAESVAKTLLLKPIVVDPLPDAYTDGMRNLANTIVNACFKYGPLECN